MTGHAGRVWGEYRFHTHMSATNLVNAALVLCVCLPSALVVMHVKTSAQCVTSESQTKERYACFLYMKQPYWLINLLFFLNIDLGFWIIGLISYNFWLIDPYWTLFPMLISVFYGTHPAALKEHIRLKVCVLLIWLWGIRLTHSYFRRENWKFGQREDWRYTDMAKNNPKSWWWKSFWAVGVAQHLMLCPLILPLDIVAMNLRSAWHWPVDTACLLGAISGLVMAFMSDNQLYNYCEMRKQSTAKPILDEGLWKYSRHPNYLGEQIWWWSFSAFAFAHGHYIAILGPLINSLVLVKVTDLTENHMLNTWNKERRLLYQDYARRTPCWIPFLPPRFHKLKS